MKLMSKRKNDQNIDKFLNFAEELSWLLDNYKGLKIEESVIQIKEFMVLTIKNIIKV